MESYKCSENKTDFKKIITGKYVSYPFCYVFILTSLLGTPELQRGKKGVEDDVICETIMICVSTIILRTAALMGLDIQELPSELKTECCNRKPPCNHVILPPVLFQANADIKLRIMLKDEIPHGQSYLRAH